MKTHSFPLSRLRLKLISGAAAMAFSLGAHAAPAASWWIDVVNDRDSNVREQLARGTSPNALDAEQLPTLMLAIRSGAWQVYDALLAHRDIQVEIQNQYGETPLMYLALLGETERAAALIERGAQVNKLGWTPLHYAASRGQADTARMLIEKGAIVNAPAPDGTTALMMAAYAGSREVAQLLLDNGADATAVNLNKNTAADWARERNHTRLADELDEVAQRTQARREGRPEPQPARTPELPAPAASTTEPSGTSRYFDLDRFDRED